MSVATLRSSRSPWSAEAMLRLARVRLIVQLVVVLAAVQLLADVVLLQVWPTVYSIDVGTYRAAFFLTNVSGLEQSGPNETYRWTLGRSTFRVAPLGTQTRALVSFEFGGRPQAGQGRVLVAGQELTAFSAQTQPQQLRLLLPPQSISALDVALESDTFSTTTDTRSLGLKLNRITLTRIPAGVAWPPVVPYAEQVVLLVLGWLTVRRLGGNVRLRLGVTLALLGLLTVGLGATLPMADVYFGWLATAGLVLAAATWLLLGRLEALPMFAPVGREARLLWALMLLACLVRVVGALFPTFVGQDLHYHRDWIAEVLSGDLVIAVHSFEFGGGVISYPPGTYVALLPGLLLTPNVQPILQGPLALLDGSGTLVVALLAYRLGLGRTTARFAAILYAGSLPLFTAIAYGFSAQIAAQWCVAPLALAVLAAADDRRFRSWAWAMGVFLLPLLLHIGVAILVVVWVGLMLCLFMVRHDHRTLWAPLLYVAAGLIALTFVYSYGAASMLDQAANITGDGLATPATSTASGFFKGATPLLAKGAQLAYSPVGLALLPIATLLLPWRKLRYSQRVVVGTWVATCLVLFVIDLTFALQVRYFYFSVPIAVVLIGYALSRIAAAGRWGRAVSWIVVVAVALQGIVPWLGAAFGDVHLSLTPLTH